MNHIPQVLTPKQVIEEYPALTQSTGVLANLRCQRRGPKFYRVSRKVVYKREDVEAFLFSNPVLTMDSMEPGQ